MKKTLLVLSLSIGLIMGLSTFASAASTIDGLTGLLVTSSADVLEEGKFNAGGHLLHYSREANSVTTSRNIFPITLTYGAMPNLEVAGVIPYTSWKVENGTTSDESGLGDIGIFGKYKVMEAAEGVPAIALIGGIKLATGDDKKGLGSGATDITIGAAASMALSQVSAALSQVNAHGNLDYVITGENDDSKVNPGNEILYNLAFDYKVSSQPQLTLFGEINGVKTGESEYDGKTSKDSDHAQLYLGPGARYTVQPGLVIDSGLQFKATSDDNDWDWILNIGGSAGF